MKLNKFVRFEHKRYCPYGSRCHFIHVHKSQLDDDSDGSSPSYKPYEGQPPLPQSNGQSGTNTWPHLTLPSPARAPATSAAATPTAEGDQNQNRQSMPVMMMAVPQHQNGMMPVQPMMIPMMMAPVRNQQPPICQPVMTNQAPLGSTPQAQRQTSRKSTKSSPSPAHGERHSAVFAAKGTSKGAGASNKKKDLTTDQNKDHSKSKEQVIVNKNAGHQNIKVSTSSTSNCPMPTPEARNSAEETAIPSTSSASIALTTNIFETPVLRAQVCPPPTPLSALTASSVKLSDILDPLDDLDLVPATPIGPPSSAKGTTVSRGRLAVFQKLCSSDHSSSESVLFSSKL